MKTIFVSTLPYSATNADLEAFFSQIGPVRSCFIVFKDGVSTGCGYVQYALPEDAVKALELKKKKFLDKRKLKIELAVSKSIVEERKKQQDKLEKKTDDDLDVQGTLDMEKMKKQLKIKPQGPRVSSRMTSVLMSNLPDSLNKKQLFKKVRKSGNVVELKFPTDDGTAVVIYGTVQEAQKAVQQMDQHIFKGSTLSCKLQKTETEASIAKRSRLIVRNLAFHCQPANLENVFNAFGDIAECTCPKMPDGKSKGFGFVQFKHLEDAQRAITGVNGRKILGRVVAVDWALGKTEYDRLAAQDAVEESQEHESDKEENTDENLDVQEILEEDQDADMNSEDEDAKTSDNEFDFEMPARHEGEDILVNVAKKGKNDADSSSDSDNEMIHINDQEDEAISESEAEELDKPTSEDEFEQIEIRHESDEEVKKNQKRNTEICTLFIRNLSFDSSEASLHDTFSVFGKLRYAKITIDKITNRSKGNGFICFYNVEDADACLNEYEQACQSFYDANSTVEQGKSHIVPEAPVVESHSISKFTLDGRFLNVGAAVSKIIAQDLSYNGKVKKRASDKRNLYLMREGAIFPDTDAAEHLKPEELKRRTDGFAERKRILATNPNLFISKFRLSFRAISKNLTDIELKNTAKHAVIKFWREVERGERAALEREVMEEEEKMGLETPCSARKIGIKQAKILKDKDRLDAVTKKPKSKGIGFVEFDSHADALACLRMLNNNPEAFLNPKKDNSAAKTVDKRPIVEFAIENKLVLKQRAERAKGFEQKRKRQEEASEKGTRKKSKSPKDDEKTTKSKMSYKDRMLLRKEKRKAKKSATEKVETPSPGPPKQKLDAKPKKQDKLKKDGEFENQVLNLKQKLFGKKE